MCLCAYAVTGGRRGTASWPGRAWGLGEALGRTGSKLAHGHEAPATVPGPAPAEHG